MTVCAFHFMHAVMDSSTKTFKCSLPGALAEGESSKDMVDRRASVSPS